jgi:hypothetical protein
MSDHARTLIRTTVAGILKQETGLWAHVYESRIDYPRAVWPYLKIYADRDDNTRLTVHSPHTQEHALSLNIVGLLRIPAGETESIEDQMDAMSALIEQTLTEAQLKGTLEGVKELTLQSAQMDVILSTDDTISHAEVTTNWLIKYMTLEGQPETLV